MWFCLSLGHLTSKSDVYSFGVVLLEMLTGRRSMDKNRPNGEQNLVEWVRPHLGERRRFYRLLDPRLEGRFSIKGAQKALQLAAQCLSRDQKARPLMSEVVEVLKPLPDLKDMASSSSYFQALQAERGGSGANARNSGRIQLGLSRTGHPIRSLSVPNGQQASPCHLNQRNWSPKPGEQLQWWIPAWSVNHILLVLLSQGTWKSFRELNEVGFGIVVYTFERRV